MVGFVVTKIISTESGDVKVDVTRGQELQYALFDYLDAWDERMRADEALYGDGEETRLAGRFIRARDREEATLERIRDIVRPLREDPELAT